MALSPPVNSIQQPAKYCPQVLPEQPAKYCVTRVFRYICYLFSQLLTLDLSATLKGCFHLPVNNYYLMIILVCAILMQIAIIFASNFRLCYFHVLIFGLLCLALYIPMCDKPGSEAYHQYQSSTDFQVIWRTDK